MTNSKTNWILLRGLARSKGHWLNFPEIFSESLEANVHLIDLPGMGDYKEMISPNSINQIMELVRGKAKEKNLLNQPINLLAPSLGAMVCWEWIKYHPKEIESAVLINTTFGDYSPFWQRMKLLSLVNLLYSLTKKEAPKKALAQIKSVSNDKKNYQSNAHKWAEVDQTHPINPINIYYQLFAAKNYKAGLERPSVKVLLLASRKDNLASYKASKKFSEKIGFPLELHPWAGHDLTLDDPQWVIEMIKKHKVRSTRFPVKFPGLNASRKFNREPLKKSLQL